MKKHVSPLKVQGYLFLAGGLSALYLGYSFGFGTDKNPVFLLVVTLISAALFVVDIVLYALMAGNKSLRTGDEFTTKILRKSGLICFGVLAAAITVLFIAIQVVMAQNYEFEGAIGELIDLKMILCVMAGIQIFCIFLFTLLVLVLSKKGDEDEF